MSLESKPCLSDRKPVKPTMILAIVATWLASNFYFIDRYKQLVYAQSGAIERLIAVVFILWIVLTSFYPAFHFLSFLFSLFRYSTQVRLSSSVYII